MFKLLMRGGAAAHRFFNITSKKLGLTGQVDAIHYRDCGWVPYEHKRGRAKRGSNGEATPWPWDELQVLAYALLIEEETGKTVTEGRIRYHQDNVTVRVKLNEKSRELVLRYIDRARELHRQSVRPPINSNENACLHCSLSPICLPEEERLLLRPQWEPTRLFPATTDGEIIHLVSPGLKVTRSGETLVVKDKGQEKARYPIHNVSSLIAHGGVQVTTQALQLCSSSDVAVHWFTFGGRHISTLTTGPGNIHRRIAQYHALCNPALCLNLGRRVVRAKIGDQLAYIMRATREKHGRPARILHDLDEMKECVTKASKAEGIDFLRGVEGTAARAYFDALFYLVADAHPSLQPRNRTRRPPTDKFNSILSFGYSLLYAAVLQSIIAVGLEPSLGFFHTARSSGQPLALDLMELFRVPVWDIAVIASINRHQWDSPNLFETSRERVWLSDLGRRQAISLFETRAESAWKHPVTHYSLSWRRTIELEVRLLEKEWTSTPGLFARSHLR